MAGTIEGGEQAVKTTKAIHGPDFYKKIGAIGGRNSNNGGFASRRVSGDGLTGKERARIAGAKGGRISRRGKKREA